MNQHSKRAWLVICAALVLDALCGLGFSYTEDLPIWHGLYIALANAVTFGGDVAPHSAMGYVINTIECVLVIPLFAATLSLFTSGLTVEHVGKKVEEHTEAIKDHVAAAVRAHTDEIKDHFTEHFDNSPFPGRGI